MANIIRDEGGFKYVEMQNGRFARKPVPQLFDGGTWTKIRVALYCEIVSTGSTLTTPILNFGLCSGTTNIPGDATPTNAVGAKMNANWTFYNGGGTTIQYFGEFITHKIVAGVGTNGLSFGNGTSAIVTDTNSGTDGCCLFVDIQKGSPNYTLNLFCFGPTLGASGMSEAVYVTQSIALTPAATSHTFITAKTVAFDESGGTLDAAYVYWSMSNALKVKNWRVVKLA